MLYFTKFARGVGVGWNARVWRLIGLGWYVAFCLVAGILGGLWLDQQLRTQPLFLLLGLAAGLGAAFVGIFRLVQESVEES